MSAQSVKKIVVLAVSIVFVLFSSIDLFAFIARRGGSVGVGPSEVIDEDIYLFGDEITVEGKVNGNLFCAGKVVKVPGKVKGSAWLVGNQVLISGEVGDGVKAAGRSVTFEAGWEGTSWPLEATCSCKRDRR